MQEILSEIPFCNKKEQHTNHRMRYLCLDSHCFLNRVICKQCVKEDHCRHRVIAIDKLIQPLNRLNMNSHSQNSRNDYNFLFDKLDEICQEWEKLNQVFASCLKALQEGILLQFSTVLKTFSNDEIDRAYQVLMDKKSKVEQVNEIVETINFLDKDYLRDTESVKKFSEVLTERFKKSINKTSKKVDAVLNKMVSYIKELDFTNYHEYKEFKDNEESGDKLDGDRVSKIPKEEEEHEENVRRLEIKNGRGESEQEESSRKGRSSGVSARRGALRMN